MSMSSLWRALCASAITSVFALYPAHGWSQKILDELEAQDEGGQDQHRHGEPLPHAHPTQKKPSASHQRHQQKGEHRGHGARQQTASGHTRQHGGAAHSVHGGTAQTAHQQMPGFLGPYPIQREGSGTSWLPDTTPHAGVHATFGEWQTMYHALFNLVYDKQGGPRGDSKTFVSGMVMGMAQRPLGDGTFGLRAMLSPDPFMGPGGYPLLLATGETANGRDHLVDRQHPHDLFMELAATYSYPIAKHASVFVYAGLPGEPALGPPAFMHRTNGVDIPEAPITHHWLDSTHITFGVVTAGIVLNTWKLEASAFKGREPDQHRYNIESPRLDSYSARVSWNPIPQLSMQVSFGRLHSPEGLEPDKDEERFTASAIYTQPFGNDNTWSTTVAWGRKMLKPGPTLDGLVLETAATFRKTYTLFARAERVDEAGLVDVDPHPIFTVNKVSFGGIYDFYRTDHAKFGVGALVSFYGLPSGLDPLYGNPASGMLFARLKIE
jgi:hypothetical protein